MHRKVRLYRLSLIVGLWVLAGGCAAEEPQVAAAGGELVTQGAAVVSGTSKVTLCNLPRYTKQTTVRLCGYVTPGTDGSAIALVWFTVDDGAPLVVVPGNGGFVDTSTSLTEGAHSIRLYARSAAGNLTFEEKSVTVDVTPPVLKVLAPTSADVMTSTVVNVTSSVSDATPVRVQTQWVQSSTVESGVGTVTHTVDLVNRGFNTLLVRGTDGAGNTSEARVTVYFCPSSDASCFASAHWAPVIVSSSQSATTVPASGGVTFRVEASDPQSSPLAYSWTASIGTLGVPTGDATTSEVVWTPPACVPAGTTASITATVTNALGIFVSSSFSLAGERGCPPPSVCGDGVHNGSEACDDGNTTTETSCPDGEASCTACNSTCTAVLNLTGAVCGDGVKNGAEACDDGNTTSEASCPYNSGSCTACNATCTAELSLRGPYCGDGVTNGPEACDDGNTVTETDCTDGQWSCSPCSATCTTAYHSLGVSPVGDGTGSVVSTPAGIHCPAFQCSALFTQGSVVTLKATAATGSTFTGWSGGGCSGTGDCVVAMTTAALLTANFAPPSRPVIVSAFQSSATSPPSGGVTLRVVASDPQNSALAFSWKASIGTLGVPTSGTTQSEVVWTPPPCVLAPTTASLTATVTNAFNLTTTKGFTVSGFPICDGWASTGSMTSPRGFHTATLLENGKVLVVGGRSAASGGFLKTAELYDPATGRWSATGALAAPREQHTATLLKDGRVLVVGGRDDIRMVATAEVYDPASGTWSVTGSLAAPRNLHTATLLDDGRVLVAGGYNSTSSSSTGVAELYDPNLGTWKATRSPMASPCREHTATLLKNGRVLVTGGWGTTGILATAQVYIPSSDSWAATASMTSPRWVHRASLLEDGRVLVSGGYNNGHLSTAEVYDPASFRWKATGPMNGSHSNHTSTLLPDGRVLVAGGENVAKARVYDAASNIWNATGSLAQARRHHTATLLPNGKVLVTGGHDIANRVFIQTAEVYSP